MIQLSTEPLKGVLRARGIRWEVYDPIGTLVYDGWRLLDIGISNATQVQCKRDDSEQPTPAPVVQSGADEGSEVCTDEHGVVGDVDQLCEAHDTLSVLDTVAPHEGQLDTEVIEQHSEDGPLDQGIQFIEVEWT